MNFVIIRNEGKMSIDNAELEIDTSPWIPANVEIVAWRGESGKGFIEYSTGPRVMVETTRIEDYLGPIDAWINTAQGFGLLLSQAREIKIDLVDTLYNNKRMAEFPGSYGRYESSNEARAYMTATVAAIAAYARVDDLVRETNGAFGAMTAGLNSNVAQNNASAGEINAWSSSMRDNWAGLISQLSYGYLSGSAVPLTSHGHLIYFYQDFIYDPAGFNAGTGAQGFRPMSAPTIGSVAAGGDTMVPWQPINETAPRNFRANSFRDDLRAIVMHRNWLNEQRNIRKNWIAQIGSIPEVVGYNVAVGW